MDLYNIIVLIVIFSFLQFGLRYLLVDYRVEPAGILFVTLSSIPVFHIRYENIDIIKSTYFLNLEEVFTAWRLPNRLFGKGVFIKLLKGPIRNLVITPNNPDQFVESCWEKIASLRNCES